ncbi:MAG: hypothetical protein AB1414_20655, partial [bacterium]
MEKNIKRILSFSPYSPSLLTKNERLKPELQRKLQDFKVLVIPSYGLSGVDTSEILEWRLRKYVEEGGVVVCFTQKYGYEFEFLPGTVTGYGANEDQSCWTNAGYIDEYHPIMAGQDSANLDANADGYFTQWGEAKVILRRVKNQQPMLIMYQYGKGYVVACSLYTDWGYGHSHWSTDETNLIRDLITWAKFREQGLGMRDEMPETKPNGTITTKLQITNSKSQTAEKVVIKVIDPDKKPLPPYTLDITPALLPNQTRELSLPSSLIPPLSSLNKMGIYRIDYELHDNSGNTIQPQTAGSQFAISQHHIPENRLKGYKIWAVADENAVKGAKVAYTIFIKNDTDEDVVNGNIGVGVHEKGGRWWAHIGTITGINVPAHSQKSFPYEREVYLSTSTYFGLYPGTIFDTWFFNGAVARCEHGVWIVEAEVNLNITTDNKIYAKGETVYTTLKITNKKSIEYNTNLQLKVMNPDNTVIFATNTTLLLTSKGSISISFDVPL